MISGKYPKPSWACALLLLALFGAACASEPKSLSKPTSTAALPTPTAAAEQIRPPVVAGSFYPSDPSELQAMVDELLNRAKVVPQEPIALIVPHAGYVYSGAVAASAFRQLAGKRYDAIVVLGTNHRAGYFDQIAIWPSGAYSTPLGLLPVDSALAQRILEVAPEHVVADRQVQLAEHSIEVELPFLVRALGAQPFVPILIGEPSWENCSALSKALATVLRSKKALIIASTDMSHYPRYDDAVLVDSSTLTAVCSLDPQALIDNTGNWMKRGVDNLFCTLCGEGPTLTAMMTASELGANRATVLDYANSGDVPFGDRSQVVGYGAIMFWKGETAMLSADQKETLLRIARETLELYLANGTTPQYTVKDPALLRPDGAFVTLKVENQLRGCIGHMTGHQELYRTVQEMSIAAATEDPRFSPVTADELEGVSIEISVLFPMHYVSDIGEIEVGRDGLYITMGPLSGVLLPQVATEQGWDHEEFLQHVCLKAGLPSDAWQKGAALYRFEAQVFGEEH